MSKISDDYLTMMRGMYADARLRFREMVDPLIRTEKDRSDAESLTAAIGEVSPEEALDAFLRRRDAPGAQETP